MTGGGVKLSLQVLSTVQRFYFLPCSFIVVIFSFYFFFFFRCWFFPSICGCTVRWNAGIYPVTGALQRLAIASYDVIVRGFFYFGGRLFLVTFILFIFIFCTCLLVFFLFLVSFVFLFFLFCFFFIDRNHLWLCLQFSYFFMDRVKISSRAITIQTFDVFPFHQKWLHDNRSFRIDQHSTNQFVGIYSWMVGPFRSRLSARMT